MDMVLGRYSGLGLLRKFGIIFGAVLSGVVIIYGIEWIFNLVVQPIFPYPIRQSDWNTVVAIWVAEIPLAFLLAAILEPRRRTREELNEMFTTFLTLMEKRKDFEHLAYIRVFEPSWWRWSRRLEVESWILNMDTGTAYNVFKSKRYWYLSQQGLFESHDFKSKAEYEAFEDKMKLHPSVDDPMIAKGLTPRPDIRAKREADGVPIQPWTWP
jgi:hypothetical protein